MFVQLVTATVESKLLLIMVLFQYSKKQRAWAPVTGAASQAARVKNTQAKRQQLTACVLLFPGAGASKPRHTKHSCWGNSSIVYILSTAYPLHAHCHCLALAPVGNVAWPRERHFCHHVIPQEMTLWELEHQADLHDTKEHDTAVAAVKRDAGSDR
jgi:hypothetical protein